MGAFLGLYWGPRRQDVEACAETCARMFSALATAGLYTFYERGRSRLAAEKWPFEPEAQAIHRLLLQGLNRKDVGKDPIPELGFRISLWSGGSEDEAYSLSVQCGAYAPSISNSVLLHLPASGARSFQAKEQDIRGLFKSLVALWDPEEAILCEETALQWRSDGALDLSAPAYEAYAKHPNVKKNV